MNEWHGSRYWSLVQLICLLRSYEGRCWAERLLYFLMYSSWSLTIKRQDLLPGRAVRISWYITSVGMESRRDISADPEVTVTGYTAPSTGQGMRAVLFDTFGTVVDWRSGISAAVHAFAASRALTLDSDHFADAWRAHYQPSIERVRSGQRPWVSLDTLHRENLDAVLRSHGIDPGASAPGELTSVAAAWHELPPWPDSADGIGQIKRDFIVGPLAPCAMLLIYSKMCFTEVWHPTIGKHTMIGAPLDCPCPANAQQHHGDGGAADRPVTQTMASLMSAQRSSNGTMLGQLAPRPSRISPGSTTSRIHLPPNRRPGRRAPGRMYLLSPPDRRPGSPPARPPPPAPTRHGPGPPP